jgi:hypothetical protein
MNSESCPVERQRIGRSANYSRWVNEPENTHTIL